MVSLNDVDLCVKLVRHLAEKTEVDSVAIWKHGYLGDTSFREFNDTLMYEMNYIELN